MICFFNYSFNVAFDLYTHTHHFFCHMTSDLFNCKSLTRSKFVLFKLQNYQEALTLLFWQQMLPTGQARSPGMSGISVWGENSSGSTWWMGYNRGIFVFARWSVKSPGSAKWKLDLFQLGSKWPEFYIINLSHRNSLATIGGYRPTWYWVQIGKPLCQKKSSGIHKSMCYYICDFIGPSNRHH